MLKEPLRLNQLMRPPNTRSPQAAPETHDERSPLAAALNLGASTASLPPVPGPQAGQHDEEEDEDASVASSVGDRMYRDTAARIEERLAAGQAVVEGLQDVVAKGPGPRGGGAGRKRGGPGQETVTVAAVEALAASLASSTSLLWADKGAAGAGGGGGSRWRRGGGGGGPSASLRVRCE